MSMTDAKYIAWLEKQIEELKDEQVRMDVFDSLIDAQIWGWFERGGYLYGATVEEIADDLAPEPEFEDVDPKILIHHIKSWLKLCNRPVILKVLSGI